MAKRSSLGITTLFVVFISLPLFLLMTGVVPAQIENRARASLEPPTAGALSDASWFVGLEHVLQDWLPLRPEAVTLDAWIDLFVLGDSPTPLVVSGRDGWLFLAESLDQPCLDGSDIDHVRDELDRAAAVARAAGKTFRFLIAPDKETIHPQLAPRERIRCPQRNAERLGAIDHPDLVTAWDEMRIARRDRQVFFTLNTHWTTRGAAVAGRLLVDDLSPGMWDEDAQTLVRVSELVGDLTRMQGLPRTEPEEIYVSRRSDAPTWGPHRQRVTRPNGSVVRGLNAVEYRTPRGSAIEGTTVFLHDSFGFALRHATAAYWRDVTFIRTPRPERGLVAEHVQDADTIIIESVQRAVHERVITDRLSDLLASSLWRLLPRSGVRPAVGPDGIDVPGRDGLRYAVVRRAGPGAAKFTVPGRDVLKLSYDTPALAVRVPPGGLTITPRSGLVRVVVVDVPA